MKKSLLALAVAAALPAVAFAQTNIVLNGSIDVSTEYFDSDVEGQDSDVRVTDGVWSGSRFAISGTEELGGGLKGIFNIEHRLAPDTGTVKETRFWHGQAWVGLQGGFGAIRLGRQYTPMFRALAPGDTTGYSWYNNPVGLAGTSIRFDNDVSYQSPSLGGFTIHAAYVAGENTGSPAAFAAQPLTAGTNPAGGVSTSGIALSPPGTAYDADQGDALAVAAVGSFGPINMGLGYHRIDGGPVEDTTELGGSLGAKFGNFGVGVGYAQREVNDVKRKGVYLTGSAGFGPGTLYLSLKRDDQGLEDADNDGVGLTYSHGLSKRTFVYASLGYNKIEAANGTESKPKAVALGIRHFF